MKIALTSTGTTLAAPTDFRFGRAAAFLIYESQTQELAMAANTAAEAEHGAGLKAAEIVARAGAKVLITGECGPKALQVLSAAGVRVYLTDAATATESLAKFAAGKLAQQTAS